MVYIRHNLVEDLEVQNPISNRKRNNKNWPIDSQDKGISQSYVLVKEYKHRNDFQEIDMVKFRIFIVCF